ncbi:unnamed protein product [Phyllotreta striolata]|uniref:Odorant receptor n=1 Tax=Phyllotreta striolata TaxID=444603 RepID=A0A9N9TVM4_PHYSR|nr:unnamed protein product [Phyllotreta striolata]
MSWSKRIIDIYSYILHFLGFSERQTKFDMFLIYFSALGAILNDCFILYNLKYTAFTIENITNFTETAFCFLEITFYSAIAIFKRSDFTALLEMQSLCWDHAAFDRQFSRHTAKIFKLCLAFSVFFGLLGEITAISSSVLAFLDRGVPFYCYVPDDIVWYFIVFITQAYCSSYICVFAVSMLIVYATIMFEMHYQLRMLNARFAEMATMGDLRRCVEHHGFLYGYFQRSRRMFSGVLLMLYVRSIGLSCMELLIAVDKNKPAGLRFKALCFVPLIFLELCLVCVPISIVKNESENTPDAISRSDLLLHDDLRVRKNAIFLLKRCQKAFTFKAGDLYELDFNTPVQIFKSGLSIYTLMKSFEN